MSVYDFNSLKDHVGHRIEVVLYGKDANVSIECLTCGEVLLDYDNPKYDWLKVKEPNVTLDK